MDNKAAAAVGQSSAPVRGLIPVLRQSGCRFYPEKQTIALLPALLRILPRKDLWIPEMGHQIPGIQTTLILHGYFGTTTS